MIRETKFLSALWIVSAEIADNILETCKRQYQQGSLMATEVLPHGMLPWEASRPVISIFHHCTIHFLSSGTHNAEIEVLNRCHASLKLLQMPATKKPKEHLILE